MVDYSILRWSFFTVELVSYRYCFMVNSLLVVKINWWQLVLTNTLSPTVFSSWSCLVISNKADRSSVWTRPVNNNLRALQSVTLMEHDWWPHGYYTKAHQVLWVLVLAEILLLCFWVRHFRRSVSPPRCIKMGTDDHNDGVILKWIKGVGTACTKEIVVLHQWEYYKIIWFYQLGW